MIFALEILVDDVDSAFAFGRKAIWTNIINEIPKYSRKIADADMIISIIIIQKLILNIHCSFRKLVTFVNFEVGRLKTEVRSQRTENRNQKIEISNQKTEDGRRKTSVELVASFGLQTSDFGLFSY